MKKININFHEHLLLFIILPLIIVVSIFSYYRFVVNNDYLIGYEGTCDPNTQKCFIGCEDDICTKEYYYSKMTKYGPDLYNECGNDITDCESANICLVNDRGCSITYCDEKLSGNICTIPVDNINEQNNNINNI